MKPSEKLVKTTSYVAGGLAVASAFLMIVLVILAELGMLHPRQIYLNVESDSATSVYTGEPLTADMRITGGELIEGHTVKILSQSSITAVGSTENEIDFVIVDGTGADVTDRYRITKNWGMLTVQPRKLTVITGSSQKVYDGSPLVNEGIRLTSGKLLKGHSIEIIGSTQLIMVGKAENKLTYRVVDADGQDVSAFYDITSHEGVLRITGRPLAITTGSASKVYDGKPLSNSEWRVTRGMLADGDSLVVISEPVQELVGSQDNAIRFVVLNAKGENVTDTYDITYAYGRLSVTPRSITIRMASARKRYDGKPLFSHSYELVAGDLVARHTLSVVGKGRTEIGLTYNDMVSYTVLEELADGSVRDVSDCYVISYSSGTIQVTAP